MASPRPEAPPKTIAALPLISIGRGAYEIESTRSLRTPAGIVDLDLVAGAAADQRLRHGRGRRDQALLGVRLVGGDDLESLRAALAEVGHLDGGAVADIVTGGVLDDDGGSHLLAQPEDARLEVRLRLLGGVVFAVLLEVAPLARGLDAGGDLGAPVALQFVQLVSQPLQLRRGHLDCVHTVLLLVRARLARAPPLRR